MVIDALGRVELRPERLRRLLGELRGREQLRLARPGGAGGRRRLLAGPCRRGLAGKRRVRCIIIAPIATCIVRLFDHFGTTSSYRSPLQLDSAKKPFSHETATPPTRTVAIRCPRRRSRCARGSPTHLDALQAQHRRRPAQPSPHHAGRDSSQADRSRPGGWIFADSQTGRKHPAVRRRPIGAWLDGKKNTQSGGVVRASMNEDHAARSSTARSTLRREAMAPTGTACRRKPPGLAASAADSVFGKAEHRGRAAHIVDDRAEGWRQLRHPRERELVALPRQETRAPDRRRDRTRTVRLEAPPDRSVPARTWSRSSDGRPSATHRSA